MRKGSIRSIVEDAISDRESYRDACIGVPEYLPQIDQDLEMLRALKSRYQAGGRVVLDQEGRSQLAEACRFALIWRNGFLDAIGSMPEKAILRRARQDIRIAKTLLDKIEPNRTDPFAGSKLVSPAEMSARDIGTRIVETSDNGVRTRRISENGELLGTVITDANGVVKAHLADGSTVNEHFEEAYDAQEWLLARFSNNLIYRDPDVARPRI